MLDSEKEAVDFFKPYFDSFIKCKNKVNKRYTKTISAESKADFESRTHSTILNDLMTKELKRTFDNIFIPMRKYAQTTFNCAQQYHLKTKKMDGSYNIKFTPTQLALDYLLYNIQFEFKDMPNPMKKVVLGYKLNNIQTEIESVYLAYPDGEHSFLWIHEIQSSTSVLVEEDIDSPKDTPSSDSYTNRRINPKYNVMKEKENGNEDERK
jgi:hypothetical protein